MIFKNFDKTDSLAEHLAIMKEYGDCKEFVQEWKEDISQIVIDCFLDMHIHLRDWEMLKKVWRLTSNTCSWWVVMPNLQPAIEDLDSLLAYKSRVLESTDWFEPYMTLNFRVDYSREFLEIVKNEIIGIKMYPQWQTNNSERWIDWSDIESYRNVLEIMQELKIPLLVHWERVDGGCKIDELDKERKFVEVYEKLAQWFPQLKIIMEHISTKEVVGLLDVYDNLYATITLQHLLLIHNDILSQWIKAHHYCMPIAKQWDDRRALLKEVLNWNPKIMFGSDSAPHKIWDKESSCWCAGVFTAPILLQTVVEIFESFGCLHNLNAFINQNAKDIYWIQPNNKTIKLVKENYTIPVLDTVWVTILGEWKKLAWSIIT